jgi:PAS domain S-box-containing protein
MNKAGAGDRMIAFMSILLWMVIGAAVAFAMSALLRARESSGGRGRRVMSGIIDSGVANHGSDTLIDSMLDGFLVMNEEGAIIEVNDALCRMTEFPKEDLVGTVPPHPFCSLEDRTDLDAWFDGVFSGDLCSAELTIMKKNGERFPVIASPSSIRDKKGSITYFATIKDIRERKNAEELVKQSEERFRTIFEHAPVMIDAFDEDGHCTLWNRGCEKMLGWTADEMKESDDPLLLVYPDPEKRAEVLRTIQKTDGVFREFEVTAKDGSVRYQLWANFKLPDGSLICTGYDVSKSKSIEEHLRQSEEKYSNLFNFSHDGVIVQGLNGDIIDANQKILDQFGYSRDEILKLNVDDVTPPDKRDLMLWALARIKEQGFASFETNLKKKNGDVFPAEVSGSLVQYAGKRIIQGIIRDITERKLAERALRERDTRLQLLMEQTPAVLWTTDRELRFTSSVGAGLRALGLSPHRVVGMTLQEYFQTEDPNFEPIRMHRRVLEGESVTYESVWQDSVFESHAEPLRDEKGNIIGCIGIALDVTQRKTAERELKRSQEQLRALTGRLQTIREEESMSIAREIHDELGQSLTVLKMDLSWIRRRMARAGERETNSEIKARLKSMSRDVDETVHAVRRISTQLRPVVLDDFGLIGALEWQAREFEQRTGITCDITQGVKEYDLDPDRSTAVFRIFQEILTNVARHSGADRVVIGLSERNGALLMDVLDNGRGINETTVKGSRALGILGMKERAQACGGEVLIRREDDAGTRVMVTIPINQG